MLTTVRALDAVEQQGAEERADRRPTAEYECRQAMAHTVGHMLWKESRTDRQVGTGQPGEDAPG
jgi:hypothetical protein